MKIKRKTSTKNALCQIFHHKEIVMIIDRNFVIAKDLLNLISDKAFKVLDQLFSLINQLDLNNYHQGIIQVLTIILKF